MNSGQWLLTPIDNAVECSSRCRVIAAGRRSEMCATCSRFRPMAPSSSGLGHRVFIPATGVRVSVGSVDITPCFRRGCIVLPGLDLPSFSLFPCFTDTPHRPPSCRPTKLASCAIKSRRQVFGAILNKETSKSRYRHPQSYLAVFFFALFLVVFLAAGFFAPFRAYTPRETFLNRLSVLSAWLTILGNCFDALL